MKRLFICGFPCSGKTTWGKEAAKQLSLPFYDTDALLGDVRTLYRTIGESAFREKEHEVLKNILLGDAIIALGGGTLLHSASRQIIKETGTLLYLKTPFEILYERLLQRGLPLYVDPLSPKENLSEIARKRFSLYEQFSDASIDTESLNGQQIVKLLCDTYDQ